MSNMFNRRNFLQTAAVGSAALAAGVRGAEQQSAAPGGAMAKIVVGVMGMGGRGVELARQFQQQPNTEVAYVCCADRRRMEGAADAIEKLSGRRPKTVVDFRRILDDKSVDVLVCAACDHWHAPATIMACAAGKHVYVEKPCCHNPREGELQIEAARKYRRVVQVGTQRRSWPAMIAAMEKLREGAIGRVIFSRSWYNNVRGSIGRGKPAPVPDWLDWELWQGPAPRRPYRDNIVHYNWHWFWHWGTGEIGNNGVHGIDLSRWGLGVDFPVHVSSGGGRYRWDDDCETPDTQVVTFDFGDRMIVWECRNWHPRGPEGEPFGAIFYGEQGTLALSGGGYKIFDLKNKLVEEKSAPGGDAQHIANFLAAIREGTAANASIEVHYPSTLLCLLGAIAHRTGRSLKCDPKTGRILGDPEAAALWSRQYEPGWEPKV